MHAKDRWSNKSFRFHWPHETAHQEHKTEEECCNLVSCSWVSFENVPLGWTNASLSVMLLLNINLSSAMESYMERVFYHWEKHS